MRFQGRVQNGEVVLDQPLPLPNGTPVRVEPLEPAEFWQSHTLDDLARKQGVTSPASPDDLLGGWPPEDLDDDFETTFVCWRDQEVEKRP
jgi:hypothetical protein